jgi:hypothetical protein
LGDGAALEELTRERVPLDWANSHGSQGAVLILIAQRNENISAAKVALKQIEAAMAASRDGDHGALADYFARWLDAARRSSAGSA